MKKVLLFLVAERVNEKETILIEFMMFIVNQPCLYRVRTGLFDGL